MLFSCSPKLLLFVKFRKHVTFLTFVSVVSLFSVLVIVSSTHDIGLAVFVSLLADVIQVVTYVVSLLPKKIDITKTVEQEIHTIAKQLREESRVTEKIVSRLVREGVVREAELFSLIRNKEMILAFTYAEGIKGKIWRIIKGQPLAKLLNQLGFVRVAPKQNLMVIMADSLPRYLRDVEKLNTFIKQRLPKEWENISDEVKALYPAEQYKIFDKWRTGTGFKVSYILAKSIAKDFLIDFINKNSFTAEFQKHIAGRIDRNQLKKMLKLRKRKVKEIMSKISVEFLLSDIPRNVKEVIVNNEDEIKKALGVKTITDYRLIELENVTNVLSQLLPNIDKASLQSHSEKIIAESQKCYESLRKLGIELG